MAVAAAFELRRGIAGALDRGGMRERVLRRGFEGRVRAVFVAEERLGLESENDDDCRRLKEVKWVR